MRRLHVIVGLFALAAAWLTIGGTAAARPGHAGRATIAEAAVVPCSGNCPQDTGLCSPPGCWDGVANQIAACAPPSCWDGVKNRIPDCTGYCPDQRSMCAPPQCGNPAPDRVPRCAGNCPQNPR
jgi:hypothetical protein